jgi:hypothetical protein
MTDSTLQALLRNRWREHDDSVAAAKPLGGTFTRQLDGDLLLLSTLGSSGVQLGILGNSGYWEKLITGAGLISHVRYMPRKYDHVFSVLHLLHGKLSLQAHALISEELKAIDSGHVIWPRGRRKS